MPRTRPADPGPRELDSQSLASRELPGLGSIPGKPQVEPAVALVPVAGVSRLARRATAGALSVSENVIAVAVVTGDDSPAAGRDDELHERRARRNPGPPPEVLHTEYASVAGPVLAFIDRLREQIVVLIPVATPDRLRYRFLHDHLDLMLAASPQPSRHRHRTCTGLAPSA